MSDILVRHRIFWSFFILSTEKWLDGMSSLGFHLFGLNFNGKFKFKRGEPHKYKYIFSYVKFESSRKKNSKPKAWDWEEIAHHEKWSIYRSAKTGDSSLMPNRRGLYLHNNSLLCLYALLSSIALLFAFAITYSLFAYVSRDSGQTDLFFRQTIVLIGLFALLLLGNFVLFLRFTSVNNRILEEPDSAVTPENAYRQYLSHKTFETWLEKLLIRDGDIVKRPRPLWLLSPRGFENWLSHMEQKGLNVYKVHKTGMLFYFIKSAPRKIQYNVVSNEGENISRFLADGWRVVYSSTNKFWRLGGITLLATAYEDTAPLLFKTKREYVGNSMRIMLRCLTTLFILLIFSLFVFIALFYFKVFIVGIWITGSAALVFTLLIIKMLLYFVNTIRLAKKHSII